MRIEVRLFGGLADRAGTGRLTVEVADGATAGDVIAAVGERHPVVATYAGRVSVAVEHEVVRGDHPVSDGDEVALLPPVAGGAAGDGRLDGPWR